MMRGLRLVKALATGALGRNIKLQECYRQVFDGPQGRIVLKHICRQGFVFHSTFVAGDPSQTALNEGQRRLALSILRFINLDQEKLVRLAEEGVSNEEDIA